MFETLYHRTAKVLEREVPLNSIVKVISLSKPPSLLFITSKSLLQMKTDHSLEVKRLKEELLTSQFECEKQTKMNKVMQINMKAMLEKLEAVQASNKALQDANNEFHEQIKQLETEKTAIEQLLDESNELNREQMKKSTESFAKMQESIKVADEAMAEVAQLLSEKRLIQEEYDNLANTIGSVIEEASMKVDKDMEELKMKHQHELTTAKIEIEHLKQTTELERERAESAMQKNKLLEDKINSQDKHNSRVSKDLEIALNTVVIILFCC